MLSLQAQTKHCYNFVLNIFLEILGKQQHSEGFKERDEDEFVSDEMKKKMNAIPKMF
jgi:hypothetical protein